jgi:uncharacterized RDD family membrane protein YckC
VIGRRDVASWIEGPNEASDTPSRFPGERLGRPERGPGSLARPGRRLLGILIDWILSLLIAGALLRPAGLGTFGPLLVLFLEHAVLVGTAGGTIGHRLVGVRVESLDGARPAPTQALIRSLLLVLAVPALIWDRDQRGLHDKAAGALVART